MSVFGQSYRTRSLSSRRSASLRRYKHPGPDILFHPIGDYNSGENTLRSSIRSQQRLSSGAVSPRPSSSIDPELRDAQKHGSRYHIAMNLNALLDCPPAADQRSSLDQYQGSAYGGGGGGGLATMMHRPLSSPYSSLRLRSPEPGGGRKSVVNIGRENLPPTGNQWRETKSQIMTSGTSDDGFVIRSVRGSSMENALRDMTMGQPRDEEYVIRSVTPSSKLRESGVNTRNPGDESVSFDLQLIGTESMMSRASQRGHEYLITHTDSAADIDPRYQHLQNGSSNWNDEVDAGDGEEPSFSMTINETMTMDYYQPEEPKEVPNRSSIARQTKGSRPTSSRADREPEDRERREKTKARPDAASRSGHRKRTKSTSAAKPENRREPTKTSRALERSSQSRRSNDQTEAAKAPDWLPFRQIKTTKDTDFSDQDLPLRMNSGFSSNWPKGSAPFDRDVVGRSTRNTSSVHRNIPITPFPDSEFGMRQRSNIRSSSATDPTPVPNSSTALTESGSSISPGLRALPRRQESVPLRPATSIDHGSDDDYHTEIKIVRGRKEPVKSAPISLPPTQHRIPTAMTATYVHQIMKDAPENSFRQRVDVHREEGQITGPLPQKSGTSEEESVAGLLNVDLVSEKVEMELIDGVAQLVVKVRCERIVPIHGSVDLYKKTAIVVTRCIDVDLTVTEERRMICDQVMKNRLPSGKLSGKDTFELYIAFMEIAELNPSTGMDQEQLWIDRRVDEERVAKYVSLENKLGGDGDGVVTKGKFGAGRDVMTAVNRNAQKSRREDDFISSPAFKRSLSPPNGGHDENHYDVLSSAADLSSSGFQTTSEVRSKDWNGWDINSAQNHGRDNGSELRSQGQNSDAREKSFASKSVQRQDEYETVTTLDKNFGHIGANNEKNWRQDGSLEDVERSWIRSTDRPKPLVYEECEVNYGREAAIEGTEGTFRSQSQSQTLSQSQSRSHRARQANALPRYEVLQPNQNEEDSLLYEEINANLLKERSSEQLNEGGRDERQSLGSRFSRFGKTSIVC